MVRVFCTDGNCKFLTKLKKNTGGFRSLSHGNAPRMVNLRNKCFLLKKSYCNTTENSSEACIADLKTVLECGA